MLSFILKDTAELKICRSFPIRVVASSTLLSTSCVCVPSAANMEPRYLKRNTFLSGLPSHIILGSCFCASATLSLFTFLDAQVPVKFCSTSGRRMQCLRWILTPKALLQGLSQSGHRTPGQSNAYKPFDTRKSLTMSRCRFFRGSHVSSSGP